MNPEYEVLWAHTAAKDFENIIDYIANDSPSNAQQLLKKIRDEASSLSTFPERGRVVPELRTQGILQYRDLIIPPWRIIYRISGKCVYILAVFDSRQNMEDILLQRLADSEM